MALIDHDLTSEDTDLRPLLLSLPDQFMDIYTEGEELASRGGWDTEHDTGNVQCGDGWLPPVCSCFQGKVTCACNKGTPHFSDADITLPSSANELKICGCVKLKLFDVFNESSVKTLLIINTDTLELESGSLQPRHSATVILANIGKIIFINSSVGGEIENFAVLHSTIVWPKPWAFHFSENLKGLYLQKVTVKEANRKGLIKSLFSFSHTVHRLELFECDLGNVNYALVRGDFVFANISRNKWTVSQGRSLDISGFLVNMKDNIIRLAETGSGDIEMRVRENGSLTLQNNRLEHSGEEARTMFEVMDIKFSGAINL